jgi:hypothetical protein
MEVAQMNGASVQRSSITYGGRMLSLVSVGLMLAVVGVAVGAVGLARGSMARKAAVGLLVGGGALGLMAASCGIYRKPIVGHVWGVREHNRMALLELDTDLAGLQTSGVFGVTTRIGGDPTTPVVRATAIVVSRESAEEDGERVRRFINGCTDDALKVYLHVEGNSDAGITFNIHGAG